MGIGPDSYSVIIDNRAEINLIYTTLITKLGLVVTRLNHKYLANINKSKIKFTSIAENTSINVGGLQYKILFFIMDRPVS